MNGTKKDNHLRVVVVLTWSVLTVFIFGPCIIFLFRDYPYNMRTYCLCQQLFYISFSKKYHVQKWYLGKLTMLFCLYRRNRQ